MSKSVEPNQKPTGSTEVPDIVLEAVEEYLFCGALVDNSPDSAVSEGVNENLKEELGPELAALSSKEQNLPPLVFTPKTKQSEVDTALSHEKTSHNSAVLLLSSFNAVSIGEHLQRKRSASFVSSKRNQKNLTTLQTLTSRFSEKA